MDVNAVPGLMLDESENEGKERYGDINAMQTENGCFFLRENRSSEEGLQGVWRKEAEESKLEDRKNQL